MHFHRSSIYETNEYTIRVSKPFFALIMTPIKVCHNLVITMLHVSVTALRGCVYERLCVRSGIP